MFYLETGNSLNENDLINETLLNSIKTPIK